jgi:multidrug efflux pump subunit AcrA (membrane-fusion protein)
MHKTRSTLLLTLLAAILAACGNKEPPKPPEKIVNITVATVARKDLPVIESAVGTETALGTALEYDPTRVTRGTYYVRLPFPEHVAQRLKIGQTVTLSGFSDDGRTAQGRIREIRPALSSTTLSREVIVAVAAPDAWRPGGSIRGEVVLGVHKNALVVPEQSVVLRPAGTVVYVVQGEIVKERPVKSGIVRNGEMELREGAEAGETVAVDGAALLSDGARVKIRESKP